MKRTAYILLGLLLMAGAAGVFAYRVMQSPAIERTAASPAPESRSLSRGADGEAAQAPEPGGASDLDGLRMFELAVNLLNTGVGLIGIVLAVVGLRMHREARAMTQSMGGMSQSQSRSDRR